MTTAAAEAPKEAVVVLAGREEAANGMLAGRYVRCEIGMRTDMLAQHAFTRAYPRIFKCAWTWVQTCVQTCVRLCVGACRDVWMLMDVRVDMCVRHVFRLRIPPGALYSVGMREPTPRTYFESNIFVLDEHHTEHFFLDEHRAQAAASHQSGSNRWPSTCDMWRGPAWPTEVPSA